MPAAIASFLGEVIGAPCSRGGGPPITKRCSPSDYAPFQRGSLAGVSLNPLRVFSRSPEPNARSHACPRTGGDSFVRFDTPTYALGKTGPHDNQRVGVQYATSIVAAGGWSTDSNRTYDCPVRRRIVTPVPVWGGGTRPLLVLVDVDLAGRVSLLSGRKSESRF